MKTLLICPADRPGMLSLTEAAPLALFSIYGKSLVEHWVEHQALLGARQVCILAVDRPDQVRRSVGNGAKWGVSVEVIPEHHELTLDQARAKYSADNEQGWLNEPNDVVLMDRLPWLLERNLFTSCADWFATVTAWMPRATTPDRIGVKQTKPGIWIGLHTQVAPSAELRAPCWLGRSVRVGPDSIIGPMAILEDRVFIEGPTKIERSVVGPETFVGALTQMENSVALGNLLINWETGSSVKVPDPFILSSLNSRHTFRKRVGWFSRVAALCVLALTLPLVLAAFLRSLPLGQAAFRRRTAVRPGSDGLPERQKAVVYYELEIASGWLRRWPQLWNVARGDFAWVGNRPLSPDQAASLRTEFERLWLSAPIGLFSLADAMGCLVSFDDEARAHASFYAVQANWRLDWSILRRACLALNRQPAEAKVREVPSSLVSTTFVKVEE